MQSFAWMPSLTVLALSLTACGNQPEDASETDAITRDFEGEQGMEPGRGFGGVFEDARGLCVTFDPAETPGNGQETVFQMQMIENHQELAAKLNLSAASQVKAAVPDSPATVSAKTKFAMSSALTINKYSVYAMVSTVVKNETSSLRNVRLKDDYRAMLQTAGADINSFRVQCGDEFLGAYTTGGEFYGIVEVKTATREEQVQVSRELSAAVGVEGIGEASNETGMEAALKRVTREHEFRIWTFQRGGAGATANPPASVEEMLTRARSMPTIVESETNARILTGTFFDYLTLPIGLPESYQGTLMSARRTITELARIQASLRDSRANIDYITTRPEQFNGVDANFLAQLALQRDDLDARIERVYNVAQACYTDFTRCEIPGDIRAPAFHEPDRIAPRPEPAKYAFQVNPQHIDARGLSDFWSGAECYVKVVVTGPGGAESVVARTEIYDECNIPNLDLEVDRDRVSSAFAAIGVAPEEGWFSVEVWEADSYYDDFVGNAAVYTTAVVDGPYRGQISNDRVVIDVNVMRR